MYRDETDELLSNFSDHSTNLERTIRGIQVSSHATLFKIELENSVLQKERVALL